MGEQKRGGPVPPAEYRRIREDVLRLSAEQLAGRLEYSAEMIRSIEKGRRKPSDRLLRRFWELVAGYESDPLKSVIPSDVSERIDSMEMRLRALEATVFRLTRSQGMRD